jgi:hypothetical protein
VSILPENTSVAVNACGVPFARRCPNFELIVTSTRLFRDDSRC